MTAPNPQLDDLIERIKDRLAKGPLTEFDLRRFEADAEKLKKASPEFAFSALGILACIRGDENTCRAHHDNSIRLSPLSSLMHHNFAVSLFRMAKFPEAAGYARKAISLDGLDIRPARLLPEIAYSFGDGELLAWALDNWHKVANGERHFIEDYLDEDADDARLADEALADVKANGTIPLSALLSELNA